MTNTIMAQGSEQQPKRNSKRAASVTFSDDIAQVQLISRLSDSLAEISFYHDDEISMFRYEAFCFEIGVDPVLGDDPTTPFADEAIVISNATVKSDENAYPLSSSSSASEVTAIQLRAPNHPADTAEVTFEKIAETDKKERDGHPVGMAFADAAIVISNDVVESDEIASPLLSSSSSSEVTAIQLGAPNHRADTFEVQFEKIAETEKKERDSHPVGMAFARSCSHPLHPAKRRETQPFIYARRDASRQRSSPLVGTSSKISSGLPFFVPESTQSYYIIRKR